VKRLQRAAVLIELADQMRDRGSWCGETHLQKATYFLQQLFDPELDFDFILYKHGPFSFELRDELMAMRADGLIALEQQPYPYGPTLAPTDAGEGIKATYPKTLRTRRSAIRFVAEELAEKDVNQLERIATALYVTLPDQDAPSHVRAREIHALKPHVTIERATQAIEELDATLKQAEELSAA
jgi:uncharacterized protein YwgA